MLLLSGFLQPKSELKRDYFSAREAAGSGAEEPE